MARRRLVIGLAALVAFAIAGALRSTDAASSIVVAVFVLIGVVLGLAVAASVMRGRG